ncbi:MAG: hypothetical protein LBR89_01285, partial [Holosporales bacterium]|nr:hypothetical protein [Holosporales bacterium]
MSGNDRHNVLMDQYEFIRVPGTDVLIPVVKRSDQEEHDTTGVRVPDWMVCIDTCPGESTLSGFEDYIELFGWYCESSRHVKGDSSNNLRTSGTLWHSDVYLVMQNGVHNHKINTWIADGTIISAVVIERLVRMNSVVETTQDILFTACHWSGMFSYLDWSIARFTACSRINTVYGFDQESGSPTGNASCHTDYAEN